MAKYQIHGIQEDTATGDFRGIFFSTPDGTNIQVAHENNKISVTIPDNSCMHLDNTDDGQYFNFNYCAYISLVYTKTDGTKVQLPSQSVIDEMERQAYATGENPDDVNYLPTSEEFLEFKKHIVLFKIGSTTQQTNWTVYVPGTSDRILTFDCPDNVVSYDVYICGCSINTSTYATYIRKKYATTGYKEWFAVNAAGTIVNEDGGGGNACNCDAEYHETTGINENNKLWEANGVGKDITITDNGDNTATIKVPKFVVGTNNGISPDTEDTGARGYQGKYIFIEFLNSSGSSLAIYRCDFPNATSDFSDEFDLLKGTAKISVWAKGVSTYGDNVEKKLLNVSVVYYTPPGVPILTWVSKGIEGNPKSRVKKELTWKWTDSSAPSRSDGVTPTVKYRAYIFKNNDTADNSVNLANTTKNTTGYPIETSNKSLTFIPADYGFVAKDFCICRVWSYIEAENDHIHWSSNYAQVSCQLFNSGSVWVKTVDSTDVSAWKEAESIWVKTSSGWKEAEGLWVKTDTNTWSESS